MPFWYNLGQFVRGYAAGGEVIQDLGPQVAPTVGNVESPDFVPFPNDYVNTAAVEAYNPAANEAYYNNNELLNTTFEERPEGYDAPPVDVPLETIPQGPADVGPTDTVYGQPVGTPPPVNVAPPPVGVSPVEAATTAPPATSGVASYFSPGTPGVQTGIPQGGHAANAIAQYFAGGAPGAPQLSYQGNPYADQQTQWLTEAGTTSEGLAEQAQAIVAARPDPNTGGDSAPPETFTPGVVDTAGSEIAYDTPGELASAENIATIIEEGGINPETGDPNIVAGPNVLSAGDEGIFGFGSDYNEEFVENYDAAAAHAEANPTGMTTGTPLYDQDYVGLGVDPLGDAIGGAINNSIIGTVGSAITGEPLLADVSSLLPPEESFSNYGSDDNDSGPDLNNDGDPTNDTGNAGWGFTSVADLFDGGGPGTSGDSYSGGFWGGSTSSGSDDGGGSDDSGSDDGTWCCTAAYKHGMPIRKIKELRKWHKSRSKLWQDGYDIYGHWIAQNLVKGSPFWSKVTEAGHTAFVEKKLTPMSALAVAVIAPGSLLVGTYITLRRKRDALSST